MKTTEYLEELADEAFLFDGCSSAIVGHDQNGFAVYQHTKLVGCIQPSRPIIVTSRSLYQLITELFMVVKGPNVEKLQWPGKATKNRKVLSSKEFSCCHVKDGKNVAILRLRESCTFITRTSHIRNMSSLSSGASNCFV